MSRRFCNLKEVISITSLARSTLYYSMQKGTFPRPIKLGPRRAVWLYSDVQDWIELKIKESKENNK